MLGYFPRFYLLSLFKSGRPIRYAWAEAAGHPGDPAVRQAAHYR